MSAGDLLLLEVVQELDPVVGGHLPPARGLQDGLQGDREALTSDLETQKCKQNNEKERQQKHREHRGRGTKQTGEMLSALSVRLSAHRASQS